MTRRGMMLIEMLMAIGLIGTFAVIAAGLAVSTIRISHESAEQQNDLLRQERLIDRMRGQLAGGFDHRGRGGSEARHLTYPDGRSVTWRTGVETGLQRIARSADGAERVETWGEPTEIAFRAEGVALVVLQPRQNLPPSEIRLVSQAILLRGGGS